MTAPDGPPRIEVHESADALATAVAGELLTRLTDAQSSGHEPQIALTGGTIADAVHRELARLSAGTEVDWSRVVVWWGDERFAAPDSPDRNAAKAQADFLDSVGADPAKVHPMPSTADVSDVEAGADAYSDTLRSLGSGAFDVLMLGVGPDGHIASLFPGFPQLDVDDRIAVGRHRLTQAAARAHQPHPQRPQPRQGGLVPRQRRSRRPPPWPEHWPTAPTSTTAPPPASPAPTRPSGSSTAPPPPPSDPR